MDASVLASLGGFFIGTYPIFVKSRAVLATNVHPAHVSIIIAMGDSMTAGFAAGPGLAQGS